VPLSPNLEGSTLTMTETSAEAATETQAADAPATEPVVTDAPADAAPTTTEPVCANGHSDNWLEVIVNDIEEVFRCRCGAPPVTVPKAEPAPPEPA
jgi:hypothetical protein